MSTFSLAGSGRLRWLTRLLLASWLVFVLTRVVLVADAITRQNAELSVAELGRIFGLSLTFDLVAALGLSLAWTFLLNLLPNIVTKRRVMKPVLGVMMLAFWFASLTVAVSEYLFWDEFTTRFNFIAVDYLIYTREVIGNIDQSYPLKTIFSVLFVVAVALTWLNRRLITDTAMGLRQHQDTLWQKWAGWLVMAAVLALALTLVNRHAKENQTNPMHRELAGNGVYEFFHAFNANQMAWEQFYLTLDEATLKQELNQVAASNQTPAVSPEQPIIKKIPASPPAIAAQQPNVVLVTMESMSADFMATFGDQTGITPNLDRLAQQSLFFARTLASGTRTVRGLEAVTLSVPPTPGNGFVRRPGNDHMFSIGSVFKQHGYRPFYIYGGYGYFDNMNGFFSGNGYEVVDRLAVPSNQIHHETIWGIADEDLFTQALTTIESHQKDHPGQPFFAHVMTTSNHRPFTYPDGRIDIPSKSGRGGGVKYADWAVGDFLARASKMPWFNNTLFVLIADHQASSAGKQDLPIKRYHIPFMIYAPELIKPQRIDRLVAQIDMAPTLLGLLGWAYDSRFLGRDVLRAPVESDRAFVSTYQKLGYIEGDQLVILEPGKRARLETIQWQGLESTPQGTGDLQHPLVRRAVALYQGTEWAFRQGWLRETAPR